jgi:ABC-type uncharacterized transport system permease subunit
LVPALKSWWMKIHVPANFIGYGTFSLAAMVGFAYLVKQHAQTKSWLKLAPLFILGVLLAAEPMVFRTEGLSATWMIYFGIGALIVGSILLFRAQIGAQDAELGGSLCDERILGKQPVVHAVCVGVPGTPGHAPLPVQGSFVRGAR